MDIRDTRKVYAPARQDLRCYPDSPELQGLWLTILTPLLWSHNMFQPRDRAGTTMACGYRWVIQEDQGLLLRLRLSSGDQTV